MGPPESYSMWNERSQTVPQFKFWSMIIELELLMIRCVRPCEKETSHYMCDHATNSAASSTPWTIRSSLHNKNPEVHAEFMKGNFVVQKSRRQFSLMA